MTSKPNVIVVQKTTGKGTTIQGLPGKNVVTTLLNAGVSKSLYCRLSESTEDFKDQLYKYLPKDFRTPQWPVWFDLPLL